MGVAPATAAAVTVTHTASDLAGAISTDATTVTGSSFVEIPGPGGATAGTATNYGPNVAPLDGTTFAVLSNGSVVLPTDPGAPADRAGLNVGTTVRGGQDVTILRLNLAVPAPANCLAIGFDFFSNDFAVAPGTFADGFFAELDPTAPWSLGAGGATTAPDNFAVDASSQIVSVALAPLGTMGFNGAPLAQNAAGTGYPGALDWATAMTPVTPGTHTLDLSIFDRGDHIEDSAVLLDNLRLVRRTGGNCPRQIVIGADLVAPAVSMTTPPTDTSGVETSPTFGGPAGTDPNDAPSVTLRVFAGPAIAGAPVRLVVAPVSSGTWQATAADLAPGTYTAQAEQTDAAGNVTDTATRTVTVLSPVTPPPSGGGAPATTDTTPAPTVPASTPARTPKRPTLAAVRVSGDSLLYTASVAGRLKLKLERLSHGHLRGHTCSLTTHRGRACTKATTVVSETVSAKTGAGKLRLPHGKLKRGSYRLTITLTAGGATSVTTTKTFTVS
jgi:hypothetical protein